MILQLKVFNLFTFLECVMLQIHFFFRKTGDDNLVDEGEARMYNIFESI